VTDTRSPRTIAKTEAAAGGIVAVLAALATGELIAGLLPGAGSPILGVGRLVIDLQPPGAKDLVVSLFGTADKLALQVVIVAVALAIGAALGILARTRPGVATALLAAFAGIGWFAAIRDPETTPALAAGAALAEVVVGSFVLTRLVPWAGAYPGAQPALTGAEPARDEPGRASGHSASMPDWTRRSLLLRGGAVVVASVAAGAVGRALLEGRRSRVATETLPTPAKTVDLPGGSSLDVDGITPIVVPNDDFYRIDTALLVPDVDVSSWRLRVTGLVEREVELTFDELAQLPLVEQYVTIACVSNEVGGGLVGNAKWTGVPLRTVLAMAGLKQEATQLIGRSVDGFTAGMPTAWVMDESREPLIALGMNGLPLPREHGYPARLIVPGLYGYVSATKWLSELQLTTWDAFDGYWVPLGWSKEAPILTQSRIDTPRSGAQVRAGRVAVGGVAWAPDRGVRRVEVAVDGTWRDATLSVPISDATWVQWWLAWDATPGDHTIEVRATDGTGQVQTADRTRPAPDGARGHHTIRVSVA
jgi:DMSO/TMAO reductase YedYZ molybdopterin-dependent catalytic subunit